MVAGGIIGQRQPGRIEDPGLGTQVTQQACSLFNQQTAERALPRRAIQQQNARRMRLLLRTGLIEQSEVEVRHLFAHQSLLLQRGNSLKLKPEPRHRKGFKR